MNHPWNSLLACQQSAPGKVAVVDNAKRFTYAELYARCDRLSSFLESRGVSAGSRIGVLLLCAAFGLPRLGVGVADPQQALPLQNELVPVGASLRRVRVQQQHGR